MRTLALTLGAGAGAGACELRLGGELLGSLEGGTAALLGAKSGRLGESHIEAAIERAEDWLMPFSRKLENLPLRVHDDAGALREFLGKSRCWDAPQLEQAFDQVHEAIAHGRTIDPQVAAAIVLLRELAHHGRLAGIRVDDIIAGTAGERGFGPPPKAQPPIIAQAPGPQTDTSPTGERPSP